MGRFNAAPASLPLTQALYMQNYEQEALRTICDQSRALDRIDGLGVPAGVPTLGPVQALHGAIGMMNELGEITSVLQRWLWYGKAYTFDELRAKVMDETSDILWHMNELLDVFGLTFDEVMRANIAKLRERYPEKWDAVRCADENRDRAAEAAAVVGGTVSPYVLDKLRAAAYSQIKRNGPLPGKKTDAKWLNADGTPEACDTPPKGWKCSRGLGHDGPCAATRIEQDGHGFGHTVGDDTPIMGGGPLPEFLRNKDLPLTGVRVTEGLIEEGVAPPGNTAAPCPHTYHSMVQLVTGSATKCDACGLTISVS